MVVKFFFKKKIVILILNVKMNFVYFIIVFIIRSNIGSVVINIR